MTRLATLFLASVCGLGSLPFSAYAFKGESVEALLNEPVQTSLEQENSDKASVTRQEPKGFHLLCATGTAEQVIDALKTGADAKVPDPERSNMTPLHDAAARNPDPAVIEALLAAGADPNAQEKKYGRTPLHLAVLSNPDPAPAIQALIRGKADPEKSDAEGRTPLRMALDGRPDSQSGAPMGPESDAILALLENGAILRKQEANRSSELAQYLSAFDNVPGRSPPERSPLDIRVVHALIKAGADVTAPNVNNIGNTDDPLLHLAVRLDSGQPSGGKSVTEALLQGGADPLQTDRAGQTALHKAAFYGSPLATEALLKAIPKDKADPYDKNGRTPLHILAEWQPQAMESVGALLIAAGADPNRRDIKGMTPLHRLAHATDIPRSAYNDTDDTYIEGVAVRTAALEFLHRNAADLNAADTQGRTPLHELSAADVVSHGDVAAFVRAGASLNARDTEGRTPLMLFVLSINDDDGWYERKERTALFLRTVTFLLEQGADPTIFDKFGKRAVSFLTKEMKTDTQGTPAYEALRAGPLRRGETLFDICAAGCSEETVRLALARGLDPDPRDEKSGYTPLYLAAWKNDTATLTALLLNKVPVDVGDSRGDTPLGRALERGNYSAAVLLLEAGSDINRRGYAMSFRGSKKGLLLTYLCAAVYNRDRTMLDFVLQYRPDLEGKSPIWTTAPAELGTALHLAVALNDSDLVGSLLRHGLNPNARLTGGSESTPLHMAAHGGYAPIIALLLQYGADPTLKDRFGKTPRDQAKDETVRRLLPEEP